MPTTNGCRLLRARLPLGLKRVDRGVVFGHVCSEIQSWLSNITDFDLILTLSINVHDFHS